MYYFLQICDKSVTGVINKLQHDLSNTISWFNPLVANPAKFQLMPLGSNLQNSDIILVCNGVVRQATDTVIILLGVAFNSLVVN